MYQMILLVDSKCIDPLLNIEADVGLCGVQYLKSRFYMVQLQSVSYANFCLNFIYP